MDVHVELLQAMKELSIDIRNVTSRTHLKEDLEMDSTELVELSVVLEKRLLCSIDDSVLSKMRTVGEIENFLRSIVTEQVA
jgi:acyl carrier protein